MENYISMAGYTPIRINFCAGIYRYKDSGY